MITTICLIDTESPCNAEAKEGTPVLTHYGVHQLSERLMLKIMEDGDETKAKQVVATQIHGTSLWKAYVPDDVKGIGLLVTHLLYSVFTQNLSGKK